MGIRAGKNLREDWKSNHLVSIFETWIETKVLAISISSTHIEITEFLWTINIALHICSIFFAIEFGVAIIVLNEHDYY